MKQEVVDKVEELILKSLEVAEKTGEFMVEQTPEVVQQFLTWKLVSQGVGVFAAVVVFIVLFYWVPSLFALPKKERDSGYYKLGNLAFEGDSDKGYALISRIVAIVVTVPWVCAKLYWAALIYFAPKWYILSKMLDFLSPNPCN